MTPREREVMSQIAYASLVETCACMDDYASVRMGDLFDADLVQ